MNLLCYKVVAYDESLVLYERVYAAYSTALGKDNRTTHACHQRYLKILASQEQNQSALSATILDSSASMH